MTGEGTLHAIAEVSVTLAGFTGLIAIFRQRATGRWTPEALESIRFMIEVSLSTALFALLPFPFSYWGISEPTVWRLCSLLLAIAYGVFVLLVWVRTRRLTRMGARHSHPRYFRTMLSVGGLTSLLLILNGLPFSPSGPSLYVAALLLGLVFVGRQLFVVLSLMGTERE